MYTVLVPYIFNLTGYSISVVHRLDSKFGSVHLSQRERVDSNPSSKRNTLRQRRHGCISFLSICK